MSRLDELINELCPDGVEYRALGEICNTITPPIKIPTNKISAEGKYPVIDQGIEYISGYTDDNNAALSDNEYIVFGDHTEIIKFVNFRFAQGADGIKILTVLHDIPKYIYYCFETFYIKTGKYTRHWSIAKTTLIPLPPLPVQEEIVRILDNFTELTEELTAKLTTELTARKKQYEYYKNKLFSKAEVTQIVTLDMIAENCDSQRKPVTSRIREAGDIPYYGASGIVDYVKDYIFDGDYLLISEDGANLLARTTPIAFSISGKTWVNNHAHVLKFDEYATRRYIEMYLNSIDLSPYITGAAQPKLNQKNLNNIKIPLPPLDEQQRIADILDRFDTLCNDISSGLPAEIKARQQQYEYYRDKLLTFPKTELEV